MRCSCEFVIHDGKYYENAMFPVWEQVCLHGVMGFDRIALSLQQGLPVEAYSTAQDIERHLVHSPMPILAVSQSTVICRKSVGEKRY